MTYTLRCGDAGAELAAIEAGSVQCVITSPPYWGLRDYGAAGQLGLEATPPAYVAALVAVFAGVWRVLRDDGTVWLNLGDSYASFGRSGRDESPGVGAKQEMRAIERDVIWTPRDEGVRDAKFKWTLPGGIKPKDLVGIPWRVAFALQAAGWYLRSDIIWAKPNPMPESVTDRPTKAHEYLFLLTKSARYYYDANAIAEIGVGRELFGNSRSKGPCEQRQDNDRRDMTITETRNKRSVWMIATEPYPEAHFATFPEALVEPCVLAGSRPGDRVLDPFCGSGTVGAVAMRAQRHFVGIDLNPAYLELARARIGAVAPLFAAEVPA